MIDTNRYSNILFESSNKMNLTNEIKSFNKMLGTLLSYSCFPFFFLNE